ncbi:MAG: ComEC/Rec2 family competence protein, partial [Eggerthellaceae bacterium]
MQAWAVLVGALLGAACALGCAAALHVEADRAQGSAGPWRFEAVSDGSTGPYGASVLACAELPEGGRAVVLVRLAEGEEPPRYGEVFEADAELSAVSGASSSYCWRQGPVATARTADVRRIEPRCDGASSSVFVDADRSPDGLEEATGRPFSRPSWCGWRAALDEGDAYDAFKVAGLAHLVAVSGAHLSIVSASVAAVLRLLRLPRAAAVAVQALLLLCYLVLAAAPPSAVRAAVMAFAGMLAFTARRRPAALSALAACMLGCIALDPLASLSASFALSALSTLGIVLFSGLCSAWIGRFAPALPRFARDALSLT